MGSAKAGALKNLLDRRSLRRMAGARSFERGENYFTGGQVRALAEHGGTITAKVRGTREYRVKLWVEDGQLEYSCTCPVGTDGAFCKHGVAVGLAWLEQGGASEEGPKKWAKPAVTVDDVRAFFSGQDKKALVDMLMEQAMDDDRLRQRLLMKAAKKGPRGLDLATYREAIDNAVDTGGFVDSQAGEGPSPRCPGCLQEADRADARPQEQRLVQGDRRSSAQDPRPDGPAWPKRRVRTRYLESVRAAHKPKRNFMKLLDRAKWS